MNRIERKPDESTLLTMARVPLRSNFSIDAILPEIANRSPTEPSPAPSTGSEADDSSDGDVNVDMDYDTENEGKSSHQIHGLLCSSKCLIEKCVRISEISEQFRLTFVQQKQNFRWRCFNCFFQWKKV